jgi:hypothetical protein
MLHYDTSPCRSLFASPKSVSDLVATQGDGFGKSEEPVRDLNLDWAEATPSCRKIGARSLRGRSRLLLLKHGWRAFRRGLATNLHRLGVSDKVIRQILRHANVSTTMNIYVKTVSADAANAMKSLETMCATTVQPERLGSTRIM